MQTYIKQHSGPECSDKHSFFRIFYPHLLRTQSLPCEVYRIAYSREVFGLPDGHILRLFLSQCGLFIALLLSEDHIDIQSVSLSFLKYIIHVMFWSLSSKMGCVVS